MKTRRYILSILVSFTLLIFGPIQPSTAAADDLSLTFAIDTSGSMRGEKIKQVRKSIKTIVESLEIPAKFSIVTFADDVKVLISNSAQSEEIVDSLERLTTSGKTALYDGVDSAFKSTSNTKNSVIIVFSDGEDNSSKSTSSEIRNYSEQFSGLLVLVGLGNSEVLAGRLSEIAGSRGLVISVVDISELTSKLNSVIKPSLTSVLKVSKSQSEDVRGQYLPIVLLLFAGLLTFITAGWSLMKTRSSRRENLNLLRDYGSERPSEVEEKSVYFKLLKFPIISGYVKREEKRLLAAGVVIDVRNWIYFQVGAFVALTLFLQVSGFSPLVAYLLACFGGFGISTLYLNFVRNKKAAAFAEELPDTLTIIASSLKSGLGFTQAITSIATESQGEISLQFRRVLSEVQVGRNLIDSLNDVADRVDSQDFRWTISALTIQREIGGNLSEILTTTADTIRGRSEVRNEIKALSAEGRISAYVLVALPLFMLLYVRVTKPESFNLLTSTTPGIIMMTIVAILMLIGWFWVQKVVKIKL